MALSEWSPWEAILAVFLLLLVLSAILPRVAMRRRRKRRQRILAAIGGARGAKVVTLIHGKGPLSLLGAPTYRTIDFDDAEAVLQALRKARGRPVDVLLHTPGGSYTASLQIARALRAHDAPTRVLVPYLAMSGGTLIALGASEIVMDPAAILGPVDPQVGDLLRGRHSVASWRRVAAQKGAEADDLTLAFSDVSEKLIAETRDAVRALVAGRVADPEPLVARLVEGSLTHAHPLGPDDLRALGLKVGTDLPPEVHAFMETFPRGRGSVEWS